MNWVKDALENAAKSDEQRQYAKIAYFVLRVADAGVSITGDGMKQLREFANLPHANGCALGAVPACTCGVREAKGMLDLLGDDKNF